MDHQHVLFDRKEICRDHNESQDMKFVIVRSLTIIISPPTSLDVLLSKDHERVKDELDFSGPLTVIVRAGESVTHSVRMTERYLCCVISSYWSGVISQLISGLAKR